MSTIVLRSVKNAPLSNAEVDANFTNLNTDKTELGGTYSSGTANGVLFLNGSKVLTTGSALTFDGTNFATTGSVSATKVVVSGATDSTNIALSGYVGGAFLNTPLGTSGYLAVNGTANYAWSTAQSIWYTSGSEQMRLTSTGLGIGTSSPGAKLDVAGGIQANSVKVGTTQDIITSGMWYQSSSAQLKFSPPTGGFGWNNNANAAELMVLTDSGNLGLGVTPSAWGSEYRSLDMRNSGAGFASSDYALLASTNAFQNGTGWRYKGTNFAPALYEQFNSVHSWFTAPSGTAGDAISFTQAMTLDASGRLGIGTTSPTERLDLGTGAGGTGLKIQDQWITIITSGQVVGTQYQYGAGTNYGQIYSNANGFNIFATAAVPLILGTNDTERARITSGGELLVGTTSNQTGAKVNAAGGVGVSNTATDRFATVEYGSGASGAFTTITISFTVGSAVSSVIVEALMTGFSEVYLDHVAGRYSNQTAVVMRNNASSGTTVAALAVDGTGLIYTLTITTSVTHPVVKVKATVGGLGGTTTLPTITFA
jgi:hypothetical protein